MMHRRRFLQTLGALSATLPLQPLAADTRSSFETYRQQQLGGFRDYQAQLAQDFQTYQQVINEEFARYKAQVAQLWGDEQLGSARLLVHYSEDMHSRILIDYEQATLTVERVDAAGISNPASQLRVVLSEAAHARVSEVYQQDVLNRQIEQRLATTRHQQNARPDDTPVIADVLTGDPAPSRAQVDSALAQAAGRGQSSQRSAARPGMQVYSFSLPLNPANISSKAEQFKPSINRYAAQEQVEPALVLAIMHSESAFNPLARSHVPAYGLMQIVPATAGKDASERVYGEQRLLLPAYLYNSDNNIKMGSAYLHLLYYRYLAAIEHPESRLYCTIAAYNTGAGNVARAFSDGRNVRIAANTINTLQPERVYQRLLRDLPYAETRDYLQKVVPRYQAYLSA